MRADFAAVYGRLYAEHWWWRAREDVILGWLRRLAPASGFRNILDVGCGDGLFFDRLREFGEPWGVELDAGLVTDAGRRKGHIHVGPFDATFEPGVSFGLILMLDVVEHLADDVAAIRRALTLLAPGGLVIITVPAFRVLWTAHDDMNRHLVRYTRRTFARVAEQAAFRILHARYLFQWTFPAKLLVRLKEHMLTPAARPPALPPPWLNRALYRLTRLEEATWGRLPLPFGSSLLVVGVPR